MVMSSLCTAYQRRILKLHTRVTGDKPHNFEPSQVRRVTIQIAQTVQVSTPRQWEEIVLQPLCTAQQVISDIRKNTDHRNNASYEIVTMATPLLRCHNRNLNSDLNLYSCKFATIQSSQRFQIINQ
ncbi:hypothetical protein TNCV_440211 [Trichonephila clavipes]|nr:hypothetical protein TNCV_440211 [Trichonephila clavipes]